MNKNVPVFKIALPDYTVTKQPDYSVLGKQVDTLIAANFPDGHYLLRAIGSSDHAGLSVDELADIIIKLGTDKYDPHRKAVCHEEFAGYDYDIQAGKITIQNGNLVIPPDYRYPTEFGDIMYHFYEHAPLDRGYPVRIDLLLMYDAACLTRAIKRSEDIPDLDRDLADYLYKFKTPAKKNAALVGLIKITA